MGYMHLSTKERRTIAAMRCGGYTIRQISTAIARSTSTVSREIKRNSQDNGQYDCCHAQDAYYKRRSTASRRLKNWSKRLLRYVSQKLHDGWSPEQISGRLRRQFPFTSGMRISFSTLYRWIRQDRDAGGILYTLLRNRGKRYRRGWGKDKRGKFNNVPCITERPAVVEHKRRYGDWEGDTVYGRKGRSLIATLNERKSRYLMAVKMAVLSARAFNRAVLCGLSSLPPRLLRTLTLDRGKEGAGYRELEKSLGLRVYFAQPYKSWQRGQNENLNGLLRKYFPKGTDFCNVSQEQIDKVVGQINNRPRKCLGYRTPAEVMRLTFGLHFA